jgi:PBSX family phage portal protein
MKKAKKPFCYVSKGGKTFSERQLNLFTGKGKESESKQILSDVFLNVYSSYQLSEPLYNPLSLSYLLELNVYHMRCCQTKAKDTAGLGWELKDTEGTDTSAMKDNIENILKDMDESLSKSLYRACVDWEAIGYGVLEIVRESHKADGELAKIYHLPAINFRVHITGNKYMQRVGAEHVWFKKINYPMDIDCKTGKEYPLGSLKPEDRATEIIFWENYSPRCTYYGVPDIVPAMGAVQGDISRRDYNISFFDNYGVPAYAVYITGDFDPGEPVDKNGNPDELGKTPLEWEIEAHFDEASKNPNSVLILSIPSVSDDGGGDVEIKFQPLSVEIKESSFRLYRQDNRDEILAAHGVPPYRLGIVETGTLGSNVAEEATKVYKTSVIEPRQAIIEDFFNKDILWGMFGAYDLEFKIAAIDAEDEDTDITMAVKLFENAAMTPNELIKNFGGRFGLKESDHEAMNLHYIKGKAIDGDNTSSDEVKEILNGLNDRLAGVVVGDDPAEDMEGEIDGESTLNSTQGNGGSGENSPLSEGNEG